MKIVATQILQRLQSKPRLRTGFSLLETLVGLGLFALAVMVLTQSITNALLGLEAMNRRDKLNYDAALVQKHFLALTEKSKFLDGGDIATPFQGDVNWSAELEDTTVANLMKATVVLKWPDHTESTHVYFLYRKNWMEQSVVSEIHQKLKTFIQEQQSL